MELLHFSWEGHRFLWFGASWSLLELPGASWSFLELPGASGSLLEPPRCLPDASQKTPRSLFSRKYLFGVSCWGHVFKDLANYGGKLFFTRDEAQEQHSLLDTIFDCIFYFGPTGKKKNIYIYIYIYKTAKKTYYMLAVRPTCSCSWALKYRYFPGGSK